MRGAVVVAFGGPEQIKTSNELPIPTISHPNQVLIDVHTAGVNPVDTHIRSGNFEMKPQLPYVSGVDGAGVVREIGAAVSHLRVGDRVWFMKKIENNGATAEVTVAEYAFPLPKGLSFIEGACLGLPYTVAYRAMFTKGNIKPGDRVLIHGASGGVGLAACQLASFAQASLVVGTAGTEQGLTLVRRNGAHHAINHREENYTEKLKEICPEGFDLIVEINGTANLAVDLDLLSRGGRVGIIGGKGPVTIPLATFKGKEISAYGIVAYGAKEDDHFACAKTLERLFTETEFRPVCNKTYALEETTQAHRDMWDSTLPKIGNRVVIVKE